MADDGKKVSELEEIDSISDSDLIHVASSGESKNSPFTKIYNYIKSKFQSDLLPLSVANGGTGAANAATARSNLGIVASYNATTLWSSTSPVDVASGVTLSLSDSRTNYKYFYLEVYKDSFTGGNRSALIIPANALNAVYYPLACAGTFGWVRIQFDNADTLHFLSTSYDALLINGISGVK